MKNKSIFETNYNNLFSIVKFSEQFGKKFVLFSSGRHFVEYQNGTTYLFLTQELSYDHLAVHNLAHFILASPNRRMAIDFGLGSSPDSVVKSDPLISQEEAMLEEDLCVYLTKIIIKHLGLTLETFDHNVTKKDLYQKTLMQWGVLNEDESLTLNMRSL